MPTDDAKKSYIFFAEGLGFGPGAASESDVAEGGSNSSGCAGGGGGGGGLMGPVQSTMGELEAAGVDADRRRDFGKGDEIFKVIFRFPDKNYQFDPPVDPLAFGAGCQAAAEGDVRTLAELIGEAVEASGGTSGAAAAVVNMRDDSGQSPLHWYVLIFPFSTKGASPPLSLKVIFGNPGPATEAKRNLPSSSSRFLEPMSLLWMARVWPHFIMR